MELKSFIVCEYASIRPDGIFNLIGGGIRRLAAPKLPLVFSASLLLIFDCALDDGAFELNIQLRDSDGKKLFNIKQPFRIRQETKIHTSVLRVERLRIERAGDYSFEVFVGGKSLGSYPLSVSAKQNRPVPE